MNKQIKTIGNILYTILIVFVLFIVGGTVLSVTQAPGGFRMFVVMSGSMEPKIKTGSVVLIKDMPSYNINDVITFLAAPGASIKKPDSTVTHRIIDINEGTIITKGDANKAQDISSIENNQILGKVIIAFPYFGYLFSFSKTQAGFILLIVIPAVLVVYNELLHIKEEVIKMVNKGKKSKTLKDKKSENE